MAIDHGGEIDVESALFALAIRHACVDLCMLSRLTEVRPLRFSVWLEVSE